MEKNIGFIGSGNMSQAIQGGIINSGLFKSENIFASDIIEGNLIKVAKDFGIKTTHSNIEVAEQSDIIVIAVKPQIYPLVIKEIKDVMGKDTIIVCIAAGLSLSYLENLFNENTKIIKTMPNTPALVGEGMSGICANKHMNEEEVSLIEKIFGSFGKVERVAESMFDAVTAVSGSAPAYVYMMIEAMGDAAVLGGMPRDQAYKFASQTLIGAAKMVLETGEHPGKLKDNVCSPGGTTIEAVITLEKEGFRNSVMSAMDVCMKKSNKMTK